jgi:hypothetical protein
MDHDSIRHKLSEYLDGAVSPEERSMIDEHLKTCEKCGAALRELQKTIEQVKQIEEVESPAWMTQKIMAKVRVEAEQRKSVYQRLYSAVFVNLPVKAVAAVFLAAIAFYMYRDIRPQKLSEAPMPEAAVKKEAAPVPGSGQKTARNYSPPSKQLPQKPGYKALDMKPEYEKPAPPALRERFAAPAPAPALTSKQTAPAGGSAATADETSAAPSRMVKSKTAGGPQSDKIVLTLSVQHITDAVHEIEKILEKLGGNVIKKGVVTNANVLTLTLNSSEIEKFADQLRSVGTLKEKDLDATRHSGTVTIELLIASPPHQVN